MKTVLLIPGYREDLSSRDYSKTIKAIESKGYKVKFVPINWRKTTIDDWITEFNATYGKYQPNDTILAGFSFGAMIAFLSATQRNPYELWLFSLSPYYLEDASSWKKSYASSLGHRRISAFKRYSFNDLAKQINCKTMLVIGSKEADKYPNLLARFKAAAKLIKNNKAVVAENSDHDVGDSNYIDAIVKVI